jgi:hypothetical protein
LSEEPKGFYNKDHQPIERKDWKCTKSGMILYKGKKDHWYLEFPDPDNLGRIDCNTIELMTFVYHLQKTDGNLDKSYARTWK